MLNMFFGFSGRLRRRDFIVWSILVPLILILPPAIGVATTATSTKTTLVQDLEAAGVLWQFFGLIALANYISVALYWKRLNDVDEDLQRKSMMGFMRWAYALLTGLNTLVICLSIVASGDLEGSAAGLVVLVFWSMACWQRPHQGPNGFGSDPRDLTGRVSHDPDEVSPAASSLDAALQRALEQRTAQASAVISPKLARSANPALPGVQSRPSFGKRG